MDPNQKKPSQYTVEELKREGGKIRAAWVDPNTTDDWLQGRTRNQVLVLALLLRHECLESGALSQIYGSGAPAIVCSLVPELCRRLEFIGEKYRELSQDEREARDALERSRAEEDRLRLYENRARELLAENDKLRLQTVNSGVELANEAQQLREKNQVLEDENQELFEIKRMVEQDPDLEGMTIQGAVERWQRRAEEADTDAADLQALVEHLGIDGDQTLDDMLVELEQKAVYAPLLEHTGLQREVERGQYEIRDLKERLCAKAQIDPNRAALWSNEKLAREVVYGVRAQVEDRPEASVLQLFADIVRNEPVDLPEDDPRIQELRERGWIEADMLGRWIERGHAARVRHSAQWGRIEDRGRHKPRHWAQKNPGRADHYWGLLRAVGDALGINIEDEHLAPCDLTELMDRILGSVDRPELENLFEEWKRDRDQEAQDHGTTGDRDQVPRGLVLAEDPRPAQWQTDLEQISRLLEHYETEARPRDQTELEGVVGRVTTVIQTLDGKLNLAQEEHESIHRVLDQYMGGRGLRQAGESLRDRVVRCLATMSQNIDHARAQHDKVRRETIGLESRAKGAEAARDQAYQELSEIRNALIEVGIEFPTEPNTKAIERIADERDRARKEIEAIDRHMRPLGLSQGVSVLQRVCELVDRCEGSERSREAVEYLKLVSEYLTEYEPATGPVPLDELGDRGVVARVRKVVDKLASDLCRFKKETQTLVQELEYIKTHLKPYDIPSGPVSERVRLLTVRYQGLIKENEQLVAARALETVDTVRRRHGLEPLEKTDPGSEGIDAIRLICERAVLRYEGTFEGIEEAIGAQVRIRNEGGVFTAANWAKALCELSGCSQLLDGHMVKVLLQGRPDVGPEGSSDAYFRLRPR